MRREVSWWRLAGAVGAGALAQWCGLGLAAASAWMIARAAERPPLVALGLVIVAVRGCAVFKGVFRYAERLAGHDAALESLAGVRVRLFTALGRGRWRGGDAAALNGMLSDVDCVQDLLLRCLLPASGALLGGGAGLALVTVVHPRSGAVLAAGLLAAGVLLPLAAALASCRTGEAVSAQRDALAAAGLDLVEGADELTVHGAAAGARADAGRAAARLAVLERRDSLVADTVAALGLVVQTATALAVLLAVREAGTVTTATLVLTALVAVELVLPLGEAARQGVTAWPAARRIAALLRAPEAGGPADPRPVPPGPLRVELLGASVRYGARTALEQVDLRVERGRRIAVVGASGAGKSTLLAALSGAVPLDRGTALLAGLPLASYAPDDVRRAVCGLAQDAHVFATTVRANLLLARPGATDADLTGVLRRARLLDDVEALPLGRDTPVTPQSLSGGQRRRLLLARALLADPGVLLLDEPTEGLDAATADELVRELFTSPGGGTVVLVAHRLAALRHADEIVVMDGGRVAQRGTHTALAAVPGPYRDLLEIESLTTGGEMARI
ncbi:thiol reductant ABC exporter subunit CydC [Actinocorallia populi]|uniref:thiol reductant ABC exporter subunit CydC n=1 Tax=Actinocorallia populi TaxID=2079200 RepID=UPI00130062E5|nr:thiol reductant ABC exporter subunit CydC [Actinocorallia populi]